MSDFGAVAVDRPEWLPEGWTMEIRVRKTGASAGICDKYYKNPVIGCRLRSKNAVLHYLQAGKLREKTCTDMCTRNCSVPMEGSSEGLPKNVITEIIKSGKKRSSKKRSSKKRSSKKRSSLEALPEGWMTEIKTRKRGGQAGATYKVYIAPFTGYKFYSKREAIHYIETGRRRDFVIGQKRQSVNTLSVDKPPYTVKRQELASTGARRCLFGSQNLSEPIDQSQLEVKCSPLISAHPSGVDTEPRMRSLRKMRIKTVGRKSIPAKRLQKQSSKLLDKKLQENGPEEQLQEDILCSSKLLDKKLQENGPDEQLQQDVFCSSKLLDKKLQENVPEEQLQEDVSQSSKLIDEKLPENVPEEQLKEDVSRPSKLLDKKLQENGPDEQLEVDDSHSSKLLDKKLQENGPEEQLEEDVSRSSKLMDKKLKENGPEKQLKEMLSGNRASLEVEDNASFENGMGKHETRGFRHHQSRKPRKARLTPCQEQYKDVQLEHKDHKLSENGMTPEVEGDASLESGVENYIASRVHHQSSKPRKARAKQTSVMSFPEQLEDDASLEFRLEYVMLLESNDQEPSKDGASLVVEDSASFENGVAKHKTRGVHRQSNKFKKARAQKESLTCKEELEVAQTESKDQKPSEDGLSLVVENNASFKNGVDKHKTRRPHHQSSKPMKTIVKRSLVPCREVLEDIQLEPKHWKPSENGLLMEVEDNAPFENDVHETQNVYQSSKPRKVRARKASVMPSRASNRLAELRAKVELHSASAIACATDTLEKNHSGKTSQEEPFGKLENEKFCKEPESLLLGDSWSDPCLQFAFQTLKGSIPVVADSCSTGDHLQQQLGSSPTKCSRS